MDSSASSPASDLAAQVRALERLEDGGVFFVDAQQNIVAFGPEMERITGFRAEEVLGRHCLTALRCEACLRRCGVFEDGEVGPTTLTLYRKDGRAIRVVKRGAAVPGEGGERRLGIERVRLASEPAAGDRGAEGAPTALSLGAAEDAGMRNFEALLRALGRLFVAVDLHLRVVRFSSALPELVGVPAVELQGSPVAELLGEQLFGPGSSFLEHVLAGARREGWRASLRRRGAEPLPVSVSAAPVGHTPGASPGTGCHPAAAVLIVIRPDSRPDALTDLTRANSGTEAGGTVLFEGMLARSPKMLHIFRLIEQLRESDATVLITGASGTGKELVARAVHARSHRAHGPFVAVNCGALPSDLLESELFGHVRGAFTGAVRDKLGRFELAEHGTLFLDEIGDLPLVLQVKLLRVLQERTFERVGDSRTRAADVRIIAATHVDLAAAVAERRFRDDLYYRLRVVPIELPPLRERREDLEPLILYLLERIGQRRGRALRLAPTAMRAMLSYGWPGNVRELENALEYATAVCEGQTIHATDLPDELRLASTPPHRPAANPARPTIQHPDTPPLPPPTRTADPDEAARIRAALEAERYHRQRAAARLGMSRWTLWRKMKEHGID